MAVFGCLRCQAILTMRPPGNREREYCFLHADDFRGCDTCGLLFCEACAAGIGDSCPDCGGRLNPGCRFEPTGLYRLPPALRSLVTAEERIAWVAKMWDRGVLAAGEREHLLRLVAELSGSAPDA